MCRWVGWLGWEVGEVGISGLIWVLDIRIRGDLDLDFSTVFLVVFFELCSVMGVWAGVWAGTLRGR